MKTLRFEFRVLDLDGEEVACDWTTMLPGDIDEFGGCETVDIHVASALRYLRRKAEKEAA